jgi:hypothetical protein
VVHEEDPDLKGVSLMASFDRYVSGYSGALGVAGAVGCSSTKTAADRLKHEWTWRRPMDQRFDDRMRRRAEHRRKIIKRRLRLLFWLVVGPPVVVAVFCALWRFAIFMVVT